MVERNFFRIYWLGVLSGLGLLLFASASIRIYQFSPMRFCIGHPPPSGWNLALFGKLVLWCESAVLFLSISLFLLGFVTYSIERLPQVGAGLQLPTRGFLILTGICAALVFGIIQLFDSYRPIDESLFQVRRVECCGHSRKF